MIRITLACLAPVWLVSVPCGPACAQAPEPPCGGDAISRAVVSEGRPARRGALTSVPETLCADLAPQAPRERVEIFANPVLAPRVGPAPRPAPYGGWPPSVGGPLRSRGP